MTRNSDTPAILAASAVSNFKRGAEAILAACSIVSRAYKAQAAGEWDEAQFLSFFDHLAKEGVGQGSKQFVTVDSKGARAFQARRSGVYYFMNAIGEFPLFAEPDFQAVNKTSSYTTLYKLTLLYKVYADRETGKPAANVKRARGAVMDLVEQHGFELTREHVDAAIQKAKQEAAKRSLAPQPSSEADASAGAAIEKKATIQDLIEQEARYDLVVLTPTDEFLAQAEQSSPSVLQERAPYQGLRGEKSKMVLIGSGSQRAGLQALAALSTDVTYHYCVRSNPDVRAIIDLANEKLVFSNQPLDCSSKPAKGETVEEFVNRIIADSAEPKARKLHLFSDQAREGWDTCDTSSSAID
jgi:hypothetical protein